VNDLLKIGLIYGSFFALLTTILWLAYGTKNIIGCIKLTLNPPMPLKNWFNIRTLTTFIAGIILAVNVVNRLNPPHPDSFTIMGAGNRLTGELTALRVTGGELSRNHEGTAADLSESFKIAEEFANGTLAIFWITKETEE